MNGKEKEEQNTVTIAAPGKLKFRFCFETLFKNGAKSDLQGKKKFPKLLRIDFLDVLNNFWEENFSMKKNFFCALW